MSTFLRRVGDLPPLAVALMLIVGAQVLGWGILLVGGSRIGRPDVFGLALLALWGWVCNGGQVIPSRPLQPRPIDRGHAVITSLLVIFPALLSYGYALMLGRYVSLSSWMEGSSSAAGMAGLLIFYLGIVPAVEEWYYRGQLLPLVAQLTQRWWLSSTATAAWFASTHNAGSIPAALILGFCGAVLYRMTGSLRWAMLAHSLTYVALHVGASASRA